MMQENTASVMLNQEGEVVGVLVNGVPVEFTINQPIGVSNV